MKPIDPQAAFDKLEAATGTLQKEREFFDALITDPINGVIVNRIIHLTTFYQYANTNVPQYLSKKAFELFKADPLKAASILTVLLSGIARTARLTAYLCIRGIVPQALTLMRNAVEQIGIYTHVWKEPNKAKYVVDADSKDYAQAFRYTNNKLLKAQLDAQEVPYRFMHCKHGKQISKMYKLLSAHFVHGFGATQEKSEEISCDFVDRAAPKDLGWQYQMVQLLLALIFSEIIFSIPNDDWLDDDLVTITLMSGLFLPIISFSPEDQDNNLKNKVDELLGALANNIQGQEMQ